MKTTTAGMRTHLASEVTSLALLWRIVRQDGVEFHFTTHDEDIVFPAGASPETRYLSTGGFAQSAITNEAGMNVQDAEVFAWLSDESITVEELRAGLFDGAEVYLSAVNYKDLSLGQVMLRRGWLGECIATPEGRFKTELRGFAELLQAPNGQVYGPECRAELGDTRCGVDLAAYTSSVTITAVIDRRTFEVSGAASSEPDYYLGGVFTFTSGPNAGRSMEVAAWGVGSPTGSPMGTPFSPTVTLFLPSGYMPQVGDTGTLRPGCDKTLAMCGERYGNILNYRGEPYLPGLDAMLVYPDAK